MNIETNYKILLLTMKKLRLSSVGMKIESYNFSPLFEIKMKIYKIFTIR